MSEPLAMTLQERMAILSFASKSAEMLEDNSRAASNPTNMAQWVSLAKEARQVLARLDAEWPAMLPLPHDGVPWSEREKT